MSDSKSDAGRAKLDPSPGSVVPGAENAPYVESLYEQYLGDPTSVDPKWRQYFAGLAASSDRAHGPIRDALAKRAWDVRPVAAASAGTGASADNGVKQAAVARLAQVYSNRGHLLADIDPLGLMRRPIPEVLELQHFGLSDADLDTEFYTGSRTEAIPKRMKLRDIISQLRQIYCGTIGAEFAHVSNSSERLWLQDRFQSGRIKQRLSAEERKECLRDLTAAEGLELYFATKYPAQKRFSLEGGDALIPL